MKDKGQVFQTCLPFGSDLDVPVARKREPGGRVLNVVLPVIRRRAFAGELRRDGRHQPGGFLRDGPANRRELVERAAKSELVALLGEVLKATKVVVVAHYSGLTVAQMQTLRRQMKQAGASVKVAKNRLAKIALEGSDVASIGSLLKGPALIAYSGDPIAGAQGHAGVDFAKTHERSVILGGSDGHDHARPERGQGARRLAVARRAAGKDRRPAGGTGNQDRAGGERPRGQGC